MPRSPRSHRARRVTRCLIGGQTGAGKSVLMRAMLGATASRPDVAFVCLDPKRTALGMWAPRATVVERTIGGCTTALVMLWREVHRRLDIMEAAGVDEWHPSLGGPYIACWVDELTEVVAPDGDKVAHLLADAQHLLPGSAEFKEHARSLREALASAKRGQEAQGVFLTSLARICRSSGVQIVAATQYPESSVLDPQFRSNMSVRVMLRVASNEMVRVILGAGSTEDITSDSIPVDERGGCWVGGIEARPVRGRAFFATTAHGKARAAETAHLRWAPELVFVGQVGDGEAGAPDDRREAGAEADPIPIQHPTNNVDQVDDDPAPSPALRLFAVGEAVR
ncbi:MAG: FtsK/SpoIIIE domain-containing protein [Acidimicrobiia bacterium]|nr:FtsK/SpoIIIE domain-containing protein [Acidimicrobiia bacterium]